MDFASMKGQIETVKYHHLNRSEGREDALFLASINGHFQVVEYLVENDLGLDYIQRAIVVAKDKGHLEIVEYLEDRVKEIAAGVD